MTSTALSLIKAVLARVPGAPDGLRNNQTNGTSEAFTDASTYASIEGHLPLNGRVVQSAPFQPLKEIAHDLIHQVWNGNALKDAVVALQAILSAGSPTDDRELLMEHLVSRLAQMDPEVQLREKITDVFIKGLWEDLPHPVSSLIGDEYRFRQADGSHNNMFEPTLGAAGRPYARSVPPLHPKMPNPPDAELVFNCLLKRDKFVPHPSGISSMLFANAVIIVHSIFRTNYDDPMKNDASGYLDLSPLYGNNLKEQHAVRDMDKCLGLLYNDTVAESRLFLMPPQVVAYLVLFNRNHNYIADMLYKINEKGKFRDPATYNPDDKESVKHFEWQERELFETARLINCGHFIQITLHDYVASILGTNQIETNWFLDPMKEINSTLGGKVERGTGNVCAVEFNLLYRWHSTMSQKDAQWFSDILTEKAGGKPAESLSMMDFLRIAKKEVQEFEVNSDPTEWQIPGHHRDNVTLKYNDDELASILIRSIEEPAAAFRACGIPEAMRPIDCLGIMAARNTYGLCTLNEFRKSLGLREYKTFQEWNEDPEVAAMAEKLYMHPDNLELYPGLLAEGTKPPMLGSGLAVGRTISRAILSDAVALVRGDRFYTTDYNVATLTTWGMEYISPNLSDGSKGGLLGKLFLRNLPRHFEYNSVYALFPFQTPMSMRKYLTQQGTVNNYSFNKPKAQPHWKVISHVQEAIAALRDHTTFLTVYGDKIDNLSMNNYGFMLGFDGKEKHDADRKMINDAIWPAGYDEEYRLFYTRIVQKLIKEHSYKIPGGHTHVLDVVRDVGNLASVYWMAAYFGIPLKTKKTPHGIMTPQELYMASAAMFTYVFMDFFDPTVSFKLKGMAERAANTIGKLIEARIREVQGFSGPLELLIRGSASLIRPGPEALAMYKRLIASGRPMDAMVSSCLGVITAAAQNQGQAFAQSLNVFMSPEHKEAFDNMQAIAPVAGKETDEMFLKYSWEGQRLDPQVPGIPRVARVDTTATDAEGQPFKIGAGDKVWISMTDLNNNPEVWTNPEKIDVSRKANKYTLFSVGMHNCLGSKTVNIAQPVLIREVMKLKNLRRAPGPAGTLKRFTNSVYGTKVHMYFTPTYEPFPFPTSMTVMYEA